MNTQLHRHPTPVSRLPSLGCSPNGAARLSRNRSSRCTSFTRRIRLKGLLLDAGIGALNASVALFEVRQKNTPEYVGDTDAGREIYRAISGTTSRGIETEISGELAAGWNIICGYTYREPTTRTATASRPTSR